MEKIQQVKSPPLHEEPTGFCVFVVVVVVVGLVVVFNVVLEVVLRVVLWVVLIGSSVVLEVVTGNWGFAQSAGLHSHNISESSTEKIFKIQNVVSNHVFEKLIY